MASATKWPAIYIARNRERNNMKRSSIWNRNYTIVFLVNILTAFSFHILTPTIPKYVVSIGSTLEVAGFTATAFTITAIVTRPIAGYYVDLKRKRVIMTSALLIISAAILGYGFFRNTACVVLFRLLHGVGWGMATTATSTVAVAALPEEKIGSGIGLFGIASSIASVFAPNLGLELIERMGYFTMFLIAFSLAACGCLLSLAIDEGTLRKSQAAPEKKSLLQRVFAKQAALPAVTILCVGLGMASISNFIVLFAEGMEIENIGYFFTVAGAVMLVMRPLFGRLSDGKNSKKIVLIALVGYTSVFVVLGLAGSFPVFMLAAALYGVFYGALCPIVQTWCVKSVDVSQSGSANSTYYTALDIGQGLGAALAGVLSANLGYRAMYFIMAIPQICAIIVATITNLGYFRKKREAV